MTNSTTQRNEQRIVIHTDGACIGNPGPGGWAVLFQTLEGEQEIRRKTISGGTQDTTNNRMEMLAAIEALERLKNREKPVSIISDSQLLIKGMNDWLHGWKLNGWKSSSGKQVKNVDLWKRLDALDQDRLISWEWVKGHAGDPFNELVDGLANASALRQAG